MISSFVKVFMTPDKEDSTGKGTNIYPSCWDGTTSVCLIEYCQRPFKFIQSVLWSCGLGYSCQTFFGSKLIPQLVFILSPTGAHFHLSSGSNSSDLGVSDSCFFSVTSANMNRLSFFNI